MPYVNANDGTRLFFEESGAGRPLVLLHGWTFSGRVFRNIVPELARNARVVTPDLRGHGRSDKPGHGYNVARLSADLRDLLAALDLRDATTLGWSLGCPVIWSYLELFGRERVRDAVLVEQSPRQFRSAEWRGSHAQSFDPVSNAVMLEGMKADPAGFDAGNLDSCAATPIAPEERAFLLREMALAPVEARSALMTDHTGRDWRPLLPRLDLPALVMVAGRDAVFPDGGPEWVGEAMPNARTVRFERSSHMIYHDEREAFLAALAPFLTEARP